jgi:hypothetical protein
VLTTLIALGGLVVIGAAAEAATGGSKPTASTSALPAPSPYLTATSAAARPKSSAKPSGTAKAEAACYSRAPASSDIYVRMLSPGIQWTAQELGGGWAWNATLGKCLTSVQMIIATAPMVPGSCTQVGYVADNPDYDPNANVAAPLKQVDTQAGPAC